MTTAPVPTVPTPDPGSEIKRGRRALFGLGAGLTVAALAPTGDASAAGPKSSSKSSNPTRAKLPRGRYVPGKYKAIPLPSARELHLTSRFTYGWTPALSKQIEKHGGLDQWWEKQLTPQAIPNTVADSLYGRFRLLNKSPDFLAPGINMENARTAYDRWMEFDHVLLGERATSQRQVLEMMTEFWEHSLHVPGLGILSACIFRPDYHYALRTHALGTYEDLLFTAMTHPAMGLYLNNAQSTRTAPNENLGREVLELHSVGVGNFTEDDVKASARILTGWRVSPRASTTSTSGFSWDTSYDPNSHWVGPLQVLDFFDDNADTDGRDLTRRYLSYLARHPLTAQRIARRLAVRFVSDTPPKALVDRLAAKYLASDTAIVPVLRTLVASPEFKKARRVLRTPTDDVVATLRSLDIDLSSPKAGVDWLGILSSEADCGTLFHKPSPNGDPLESNEWASAARFFASFRMHWEAAGGWWFKRSKVLADQDTWFPRQRVEFADYVDYLSRRILGVPSTRALLTACCLAAGLGPQERLPRNKDQRDVLHQQTVGTILDSPQHMTR